MIKYIGRCFICWLSSKHEEGNNNNQKNDFLSTHGVLPNVDKRVHLTQLKNYTKVAIADLTFLNCMVQLRTKKYFLISTPYAVNRVGMGKG